MIFFLPLIRARLRKNHFQLSLKEMISISINRVTLFSSSKYFSIRCKNEWHEISDAPFDDDDDLSCFDLQGKEKHRCVENPAVTAFHNSNRVLTRTYSSQKGFNSPLFKHFARLILPPFFFSLPIPPFLSFSFILETLYSKVIIDRS